MPPFLSGPGLGLPLPQNLYPSELNNAPADTPTNQICLAPGDVFVVPAGDWYINPGQYSVIQFLDPITNTWRMVTPPGWNGFLHISSDGFNIRVANLLGCPVSATITAPGNGSYVQATTTIAAVPGNSTWLPIVGGQLGTVATFSINIPNAGAGYGIAPIVLIAPPPPAANNANGVGGIPAAAYVGISSGTISGFTFTNPGAGYPSAPAVVVVPHPFDPNLATGITQASITVSLIGTGSICGVLCTNPGAPLATVANFTLTPSGAGSGATISANVLQTVTAATVTGQGIGYPVSGNALLTTVGGAGGTSSFTNSPDFLRINFRPRPAQIGATVTSGGTITTQVGQIYDGGLFLSTPTFVMAPPITGSVALTTQVTPTITFSMGGVSDIVWLQPAP